MNPMFLNNKQRETKSLNSRRCDERQPANEATETILLSGRFHQKDVKIKQQISQRTGDAAGVPGHRVGDVVGLGGRDDDPGPRAVQEAHPQHAVAAGPAGRQHGLVAVDLHLSARQRRQVAVVEHLDRSKSRVFTYIPATHISL